jgi:hypothetical protein
MEGRSQSLGGTEGTGGVAEDAVSSRVRVGGVRRERKLEYSRSVWKLEPSPQLSSKRRAGLASPFQSPRSRGPKSRTGSVSAPVRFVSGLIGEEARAPLAVVAAELRS